MAKITINGKEYDGDSFSNDNNEQKNTAFFGSNLEVNGKKYSNVNDLPPHVREMLQKKLGKINNMPFLKNFLQQYGLDLNQLQQGGQTNNASSQQDLKAMMAGNNIYSGKDPFGNSFSGSGGPNGPSGSQPTFIPMGAVKKAGCTAGIIGVAVVVAGIGAMMFFINQLTGSWEETFELSGDTTHFNPITAVNEIRSHIDPNAKLASIDINYVRADGTMDLSAKYRPTAEYEFYRELPEPPKDAPPVGAGGTVNGKWYEQVEADVYEPGQWRHVKSVGGGVSTEYSYSNKGIDLDRSSTPTATPPEFIEDPQCEIKKFWDEAIKKGAPKDAVARVSYDKQGYEFRISDADINLEFGNDCKLIAD